MKHVGNLQYITFLKGLAILGVILVHAPQLIKEINPLIREFLHAGAFGCQLFFVISGFLAVKSWERLLAKYENSTEKNRTTYKTFLKKRYLSIELLVGAQRFLVYRHVDSAIFLNSLLCPNNR